MNRFMLCHENPVNIHIPIAVIQDKFYRIFMIKGNGFELSTRR